MTIDEAADAIMLLFPEGMSEGRARAIFTIIYALDTAAYLEGRKDLGEELMKALGKKVEATA